MKEIGSGADHSFSFFFQSQTSSECEAPLQKHTRENTLEYTK